MSKQGKFASQKRKKGGFWKWLLLTILIILLALIVAASVVIIKSLNKINRVNPTETYLAPEVAETMFTEETEPGADPGEDGSDITWPTADVELIGENDNITNILLIGQDRRPGEGRARSDSMILVSFNKEKKTVTMISFLRDNYVQIPGGYQDNRLNVAYAYGGMSLLNEALEVNFGVKVDANVEVDFSGFTNIIDLLGGVDVNLTAAEADYLRAHGSLRAGMNHLNGDTALAYARIRYLDSDFGRTNRQRNVLNSLIREFKNTSIPDALNLMDQILPMLTTDMTNSQMVGYLTELLPILASAESVNSVHIPGDDQYYNATIRGMMVLVPDLTACRQSLSEILK